jgi:hypothetical protein
METSDGLKALLKLRGAGLSWRILTTVACGASGQGAKEWPGIGAPDPRAGDRAGY